MAFAAEFHPERLLGRACGEGVAAGTNYLGIGIVFGVYLFLHILLGVNADLSSVLGRLFKCNCAIDKGKEGMVFA